MEDIKERVKGGEGIEDLEKDLKQLIRGGTKVVGVKAATVAEAIALKCWLEKIGGREEGGVRGWCKDLNRAEWIDRGNKFVERARVAVLGGGGD